jgi:Rad52/22 family double-strand break repair protein
MTAPERGLTGEQLDLLLRPLSPTRVREHKGQAHLEAWDIRRWLTRVFGFSGWSDEILTCAVVHETVWPWTDSKGEPVPGKNRATVVYRVTLRLTIKDVHGNVINTWEDGATGEAVNQASVGDAHDLALKAAVSQALKRAAVNLGDQFGLSLYNKGSIDPVIIRTLGHPTAGRADDSQVPEDAPVVGGELDEQDAEPATQPAPEQPPMISDGQLKAVHALIAAKFGPKSDEQRHAGFSKFTGREITSAKQLTYDEASRFLDATSKQPDYVKPQPAQAADGNENFRQGEALLKLEQGQEAQQLEQDLRDEIESAGSPNDLGAAMSMVVALRDEGRLSAEQFARLAGAADERAARARKQLAGVAA